MELSVTVQRVRGGVDLHIRISRRRSEVKRVRDWRQSFTSNDLGLWATDQGFRDRRQATAVFNILYDQAQAGRLVIGIRCSQPRCREKQCKGVHRIEAEDFAALDLDQLNAIKGIGREIRYRILIRYHQYWTKQLERGRR